MPRIKILSNMIKQSSSKQVLKSALKFGPTHISIFCSQQQGENLLQALPDVRPIRNLDQTAKTKTKLTKTHLKLQSSARQAFKLALSSNQIRIQQKCFVLNKRLLIQNQNSQKQSNELLDHVRSYYKGKSSLLQLLNKPLQTLQIKSASSSPQLNGKWVLDDSFTSVDSVLNQDYQMFINPTIVYGTQAQTQFEECISFPFYDFMIPRYNRLLIHYYNQHFKSKFIYTQGFLSRVIQHHVQHLEGRVILDWRVNHGQICINSSVQKYFPKSIAVLQDYTKALRVIFKQFPQLIQIKKQYFISHTKLQKLMSDILSIQPVPGQQISQKQTKNTRRKNQVKQSFNKLSQNDNYNSDFTVNKNELAEQLSFQDDSVTRIVKHFKKEFNKFDEKVQLGLISLQKLDRKGVAQTSQETVSLNPQYNQVQYSKTIQIKFINLQIQKNSSKSQKKAQKKQNNAEDHVFDQDYEMSDQELDKIMAQRKKGKKKKK